MYPHERSLVKQLADKPFAIIGVNSDSDLKEIRKIVKRKNLTWRSFQNEQAGGSISNEWAIRGWPSIFLLDQEGRIRYRDVRGDRLDDAITKLLDEMDVKVKISHEDEEDDDEKADEEDDKEADADENDASEESDKSGK